MFLEKEVTPHSKNFLKMSLDFWKVFKIFL